MEPVVAQVSSSLWCKEAGFQAHHKARVPWPRNFAIDDDAAVKRVVDIPLMHVPSRTAAPGYHEMYDAFMSVHVPNIVVPTNAASEQPIRGLLDREQLELSHATMGTGTPTSRAPRRIALWLLEKQTTSSGATNTAHPWPHSSLLMDAFAHLVTHGTMTYSGDEGSTVLPAECWDVYLQDVLTMHVRCSVAHGGDVDVVERYYALDEPTRGASLLVVWREVAENGATEGRRVVIPLSSDDLKICGDGTAQLAHKDATYRTVADAMQAALGHVMMSADGPPLMTLLDRPLPTEGVKDAFRESRVRASRSFVNLAKGAPEIVRSRDLDDDVELRSSGVYVRLTEWADLEKAVEGRYTNDDLVASIRHKKRMNEPLHLSADNKARMNALQAAIGTITFDERAFPGLVMYTIPRGTLLHAAHGEVGDFLWRGGGAGRWILPDAGGVNDDWHLHVAVVFAEQRTVHRLVGLYGSWGVPGEPLSWRGTLLRRKLAIWPLDRHLAARYCVQAGLRGCFVARPETGSISTGCQVALQAVEEFAKKNRYEVPEEETGGEDPLWNESLVDVADLSADLMTFGSMMHPTRRSFRRQVYPTYPAPIGDALAAAIGSTATGLDLQSRRTTIGDLCAVALTPTAGVGVPVQRFLHSALMLCGARATVEEAAEAASDAVMTVAEAQVTVDDLRLLQRLKRARH